MNDDDLFAFVQIAAIIVAGLASLALVAFQFFILSKLVKVVKVSWTPS